MRVSVSLFFFFLCKHGKVSSDIKHQESRIRRKYKSEERDVIELQRRVYNFCWISARWTYPRPRFLHAVTIGKHNLYELLFEELRISISCLRIFLLSFSPSFVIIDLLRFTRHCGPKIIYIYIRKIKNNKKAARKLKKFYSNSTLDPSSIQNRKERKLEYTDEK